MEDPEIRQRKRNRAKGYDYSTNGYYFVTICTKNFKKSFGKVINWKMYLNDYGKIAKNFWVEIKKHKQNIDLDYFVIMPNHLHEIIIINNAQEQCSNTTIQNANYGLLSKIIKSYKEICVKTIRKIFNDFHFGFQSSFYDRIIRSDKSLYQIRKYILESPMKWQFDKNDVENLTF